MNTLKRLCSFVLALMLVLSIAIPVAAAEEYYTITINNDNPVDGSSDGHTYEAYQILGGSSSTDGTTLSTIVWGKHIDADRFLAALKADSFYATDVSGTSVNLFAGVTTAADFAGIIGQASFNTTANVTHLSRVIDQYLKDGQNVPAPYMSTDKVAPYTISIPKSESGYYLIKDKDGSLNGKVDKDYTAFILEVVANVTTEHKGSIPTIEKKVSTNENTGYGSYIATAAGTDFYYKIICHMPSDFNDYSKYELEIVDNLGKGLDFGGLVDAYVAHVNSNTTTSIKNYVETNNPGLTVGENNVLTISLGNVKDADFPTMLTTDQIVVVYKASLNVENAILAAGGNVNSVQLKYTNDANHVDVANHNTMQGITSPKTARVYTYALVAKKIDGTTKANLEGVQFKLYRNVHESASTTGQDGTAKDIAREYAIVGDNGWVTGWTTEGAGKDSGSVLTTDANGQFKVKGLNTLTYYLEEVQELDGYNKLLDDIRFEIAATYNETSVASITAQSNGGKPSVYQYNDDENSTSVPIGILLEISNYKGSVLPSTGGIGTTLFYAIGGVMVAAAIILLVTKKRMNAEN